MSGTAPVVALNVAVKEPAATATEAGTVSTAALLDKATLAPPAGAATVNVMVQVAEAFGPRLTGLQLSEET